MKCPAEVYQPSHRTYTRLPDIDYPFHDKTIVVSIVDTTIGSNFENVTQSRENGSRQIQYGLTFPF